MLATTVVEYMTFVVAAMICLMGAIGVVALRNPIHNALSLIATLFGVAVLFVAQGAYFLAAIQIIVYAGAIVILFLFVIMLLGVDEVEEMRRERSMIRLPLALMASAAIVGLVLVSVLVGSREVTGRRTANGALDEGSDINVLGRSLFTDHVFAFEITGVLLTIAVVGAVVLARKAKGDVIDFDEFPIEDDADLEEPDDLDTGGDNSGDVSGDSSGDISEDSSRGVSP